jgi:probable HAF family extracellular repeat protein
MTCKAFVPRKAVVEAYMLNGVQHGLLLAGAPVPPSNFQTIDFPGSTGTRAIGINNAGQIVGDYVDANGVRHGFLATPVPGASPRQN